MIACHAKYIDKLLHLNLNIILFTVSFQQSSIHTVRCFSASFPARNNAAAATTMIKNAKIQNHQHDNRETIGESSAENRNLKNRRLLRTNSAPQAYKM